MNKIQIGGLIVALSNYLPIESINKESIRRYVHYINSEILLLWEYFPLESHSICAVLWMNDLDGKYKSPETYLIRSLLTMPCGHYTHPDIFCEIIQVTCEPFSKTQGREIIRFLKENDI